MLAKAESVRHQSMRVTVASLETKGLVSGAPDPADGRQTVLTAASLKGLKTGRAVKDDWLFCALQAQLTNEAAGELGGAAPLAGRAAEDHQEPFSIYCCPARFV